MFPKYRHTPVIDPGQKRCPVCNHAVYSLGGIHPQCAINRATALESKSMKEAASKPVSSIALRTDTDFEREPDES